MKETALITGASSGIGYELAKLFAADGYELILVARSEKKLRQVADELHHTYQVAVMVMPMDLGTAGAAEQLFNKLAREERTIDILINNAGYGWQGYFHGMDLATASDMIQLNIQSLLTLCRLFLPGMLQRGRGRIMNVASTAAFQPGPLMAVYYATKAFVLSFSLALAAEYRKKGITITTLCPGPTLSDFQKRAGIENTRLARSNLMPFMTSAQVAKIAYQGLRRGRRMIVPGFMNKLGVFSTRLLPRSVLMAIIRSLHE